MTQRLYYDDPYLQQFTARVIARDAERNRVALDRTAFYPEGGGQPGDWGTLDGVAVTDTQAEGELVWHQLAAPLAADAVTGVLDWTRRFDYMQQHHGQHLLSAGFATVWDASTVAVHLGPEVNTCDIENATLTAEQLAAVEEWTNAAIYADLVINARFVSPEELQTLPLRKPPKAYDRIRIVSAGDLDHTPCGGTHPLRTGAVGSVAIRRWERRGPTLRIEFVCGARALRDHRSKTMLTTALANDLSVGITELPAAIARLRSDADATRKALDAARRSLADYLALELVAAAPRLGDTPVVVQALDERPPDEARTLAQRIVAHGGIALLGVRGPKAHLIFMRPPVAPGNMGALLGEAVGIVGGKGGGKAEAAQGGGPDAARLDDALALAWERLQD